jgi:predicted aspartyl protease
MIEQAIPGCLAAVICLLGASAVHADTSAQELSNAIETWDLHALQAIADQTPDRDRQALARAVLTAFAGKDAIAIDSLEKLTASAQLDDGLRFLAFTELGRLDLRNQHYVRAARALERALASAGKAASDQVNDVKDDLRYARANLTVPPVTVTVKSLDPTPLVRDAMDLPRVSTSINGQHIDAIIDTGASNCVVAVSTAKRLHLQMLNFEGGVAADGRQVGARFAVADALLVAGHEFRNVPFIVLPDQAVSVPLDHGVVGKLEPIVGLSVLRKLGRIEIVQHAGQEILRVGGRSTTDMPPNLLLPEGLPIVLAYTEPAGVELRMSLDTGANRTALAPAALAAYPALAGNAGQGRVATASAAGISSNEAGSIIAQLTLRIGTVATPLARVPVAPGPEHCEGTLGQDVFRSGGGYVLDFDRMTVELLP